MKTVLPAIYEILKGITLVGGPATPRVYASRAKDNSNTPFIVYQEVDSARGRSINTQDRIAQAYIQVDAYANLPFDAATLGAVVEAALVDYRGTVEFGTNSPRDSVRICGVSFQNGANLMDEVEKPFLHRRYAVYLVTYEQ